MSDFSGLASCYDTYRPRYPRKCVEFVQYTCSLGKESYCLDVGCGTGILTLELAKISKHVWGIDSSVEMIRKAKHNAEKQRAVVNFRLGFAEALPFDSASFDFVSIAQSFHWFDEKKSLSEVMRVLKQGGHLAILWNNPRNKESSHYAFIVREIRKFNSKFKEDARGVDVAELLKSFGFRNVLFKSFPFEVSYSKEEYLGLLKTKSYVSKGMKKGKQQVFLSRVLNHLTALYGDGLVRQEYQTDIFVAQK